MVNTETMSESLIRELAFTVKERREIEEAGRMPVQFDEDCPETTPEQAIRFRRVNPPRRKTAAPA